MTTEIQPESLRLSANRLRRLGDALRERVERMDIPGAVALVGRGGGIGYVEPFGFRDREAGSAMPRDAIFRIDSLTKPVTSLAAMMLVEEGRIVLGAPISKYVPQFRNPNVAVERPDGTIELVPARREATVLDLLRHTSGFAHATFGSTAVTRLYQAAGLDAFAGTVADYIAALAALPLQFHPGTEWNYGVSTEVLGYIIESVSGTDLGAFVAARITGPLRMLDTGFWVDRPKHDRLAEPSVDRKTGTRPAMREVTVRPARFSGSAGLVSTASDYARFCQLILNGGTLDGMRLVSPKTVELMTANHLHAGIDVAPAAAAIWGGLQPTPNLGSGFGLGFAVRTSLGGVPWHGSVGDLHWFGSPSGCTFFIDPREQLFAILMTQAPGQMVPNTSLLRAMTYQALVDEAA